MSSSLSDTLFEFPCEFPIKVLGKAETTFVTSVMECVRRHSPECLDDAIVIRPSASGRYLSVTITIQAKSREQLDALYQDITACPDVMMAF